MHRQIADAFVHALTRSIFSSLAELLAAAIPPSSEGRTLRHTNKDKTKNKDGETSTDNVGVHYRFPLLLGQPVRRTILIGRFYCVAENQIANEYR